MRPSQAASLEASTRASEPVTSLPERLRVIVLAATGYVLGATQSKEYAEPEWYVDLWLTVVWVAYLLVFMGTIWKRKEPHIYVANWFYLAFIVTVAMLHIVRA